MQATQDPVLIVFPLFYLLTWEMRSMINIAYLLLQPKFQVLGVMSAQAPTITAPAGQTSYRILVDVVENRLGMHRHPPLIEGGSEPLENQTAGRRSPAT